VLLLAEQDRSLWDREMIARGLAHLNRSAAGEEVSEFHLQAGISACHCAALTYAATDWSRILYLYDMLIEVNRSPVVALNRAVAISHLKGPKAALAAIAAISPRDVLEGYYLYHAVLAHLHCMTGDVAHAAAGFCRALELTDLKSEQVFLRRRLSECKTRMARQGATELPV